MPCDVSICRVMLLVYAVWSWLISCFTAFCLLHCLSFSTLMWIYVQTYRQTGWHKDRHKDRQADIHQIDRQTHTQTDILTAIETDIYWDRHTNRQKMKSMCSITLLSEWTDKTRDCDHRANGIRRKAKRKLTSKSRDSRVRNQRNIDGMMRAKHDTSCEAPSDSS